MAWLRLEGDIIISATQEWIDMVGYDPSQTPLDQLWTPTNTMSYVTLQHHITKQNLTLCICTHNADNIKTNDDNSTSIIVCSDVTVLENLACHNPIDHSIARLTTYGTIEAFYDQKSHWTHGIGLPLMRFVHPDDVRRLCSGLSTAEYAMVSFQVRCDFYNADYDWFDFTVVHIANDLLCIIRPTENLAKGRIDKTTLPHTNYSILHRLSESFWKSLEAGVAAVTHSLACALVFIVQTILPACFTDPKNANCWTLALSERMLFGALATFKARPEIDTVWNALNWTGLLHESARCSFEEQLDQGAEWLISRAHGNTCTTSV
ncbi:hypothetical protein J3Q64DRAFT_1824586 [Phycomyces blakesleeanus]